MRFKYTSEHLDFLRTGYLSMNERDLTKAFNKKFCFEKTIYAIRSALRNHKITCGRTPKERLITRVRLFSAEQVRFIKRTYPGKSLSELTELFNLEFNTNRTLRQIKTFVNNRKIRNGLDGRFQKGQTNWNKGTKGLCKPNSGSFKKGTKPPNQRPIGSERICPKDGYVLIKVDMINPYTGFRGHWIPKHVHVWEQENGPVPNGYVLRFIDGDIYNIEPENLILISRAENFILNKYDYKNAQNELKPSFLALAKLEVATFKKNKRLKKGNRS